MSAESPARQHIWAHSLEAATPASRDRGVDALRAFAILGVVIGHWLVTAVVLRDNGHLVDESTLAHLPALAPVTWLLQPLAVFFLVGGRVGALSHASACARGVGYRAWLSVRLWRLARPVLVFAATWALVLIGLALAGTAPETLETLVWLAFSPLWFLAVYAVLIAATPLVRRHPGLIALCGLLVVAGTDLAHAIAGPSTDVLRNVNVPAGWLVPYGLGVLWATGRPMRPVVLLAGGAVATAALIGFRGYPASMVGVPGAGMSNLDPPSLAAVCFGIAQCGAAILLRRPLGRWLTPSPHRPRLRWAAVTWLNVRAITVFLWHQTAMLVVTVALLGIGTGPLPGLQTVPDSPLWPVTRLLWLPVFAAVVVLLQFAFHRWESGRHSPAVTRPAS